MQQEVRQAALEYAAVHYSDADRERPLDRFRASPPRAAPRPRPAFAAALGSARATREVTELKRLTLEALHPFSGRLMAGHIR